MANLSLSDLLSFAKAGYSPKDVKELLTMELPESKAPEPKNPEGTTQEEPAPAEPESEQKTQEPIPEKDSTITPGDANAEVIDYKAKCAELEEKMKKLQEQNTRQDISGQKVVDPMQGVDDFLKSLM